MKKFFICLLVCTLLFSSFCLFASAEEEPTFVFHVNGVNGKIGGEDAYIFTTQEAYDNGNPHWAITILLEVQANGLLKVKQDGFPGGGSIPSVKIGDGVVALVVHSAESNVEAKDQYPNVEEKLAALATKAGMYIVLDGIDLEAGTGSGTASLYATAPEVSAENSPEAPSDEPSSEESSTEEPSSEAVETSSEEQSSAAPSEEPSKAESAPAESSAPVSDGSQASSGSSEAPSGGTSTTAIVIIVVAAVALIAAVVAIILKRKK